MTDSSKMCAVVGIDHGTTNSSVGVFRNGRVEIAANLEGHRITPSVVAYQEDGEPLVGNGAFKRIDSANTVFDMKRLLGKSFDDPAVKRLGRQFTIVSSQSSNRAEVSQSKPLIQVKSGGKTIQLRPLDVCSKIIEKMKKTATNVLNSNSQKEIAVKKAVIAIPAHFTQVQKNETTEAARLAGLEIAEFITEPVAAAYAYGYDSGRFRSYRLLVFDLGGGTFDVTVIQVTDGEFNVLEMSGDSQLGGRDFDALLYKYCCTEIRNRHNFNCEENQYLRRSLLNKCEEAKKQLSMQNSTSIYLGDLSRDLAEKDLRIDRPKFVELCGERIHRTIDITRDLLQKAKLKPKQIDEVVLAGGSSRIPLVQEKLAELLPGKRLNTSINVDEVVAYGAAVRAAQLCKRVSACMPKMSILQKTALSLGVESVEGVYDIVVPRLTQLPIGNSPITRRKNFVTVDNDQSYMEFKIYEGERAMVADNLYLGIVYIDGLRKAAVGETFVEVSFSLDKNGQLKVAAQHGPNRVVESFDYANCTASSQAVEKNISEAKINVTRDNKSKATKLALNKLKMALKRADYNILDESRRTPLQQAKAGIIQEHREWIEANGKKATEKLLVTQLDKFTDDIAKCE